MFVASRLIGVCDAGRVKHRAAVLVSEANDQDNQMVSALAPMGRVDLDLPSTLCERDIADGGAVGS